MSGLQSMMKIVVGAAIFVLLFTELTLLAVLQSSVSRLKAGAAREWNSIADQVAGELSGSADPQQDARSLLNEIRARLRVPRIELETPTGAKAIVAGVPASPSMQRVSRAVPRGRVTIFFDRDSLDNIAQAQRMLSWGSIASVIVTLLIMVAALAGFSPAGAFDQETGGRTGGAGPGGTGYLVDTFGTAISQLKNQQGELKRLHELERNRAEELSRITSALTRSLSSGFISFRLAGVVFDMNTAARDILGVDAATEVSGRAIEEILGDSPFARSLQEAVSARTPLQREEIEHGSTIIGLTTVPLFSEDDRHLGTLAIFTDLTPVRKLETQVRELKNLADLGEIAAGIAHEFRNSLSTIVGYIELARKAADPEDTQRRLRNAEQEAAVLSGAIDGLLNFARPEKLVRQRVNIGDLVNDVVDSFRIIYPKVTFEVTARDAWMQGDSALLSRAFENLVRNAVNAIEQSDRRNEGKVTVLLETSPASRLTISDNGVGVRTADVNRFFLPFQSGLQGGFGLGLPLAKKAILLHGGMIELSGREGEGAVVTVELPPLS